MNRRDYLLVKQDAERVVNSLGTTGLPVRCIAPVARVVLLHAPYFVNGRRIDPKAKSLGAGVWEMQLLEEK